MLQVLTDLVISLNILFIYYVKPESHWLDTQTLVNKEVLRRFNEEGLEFAFPTQTILKKRLINF